MKLSFRSIKFHVKYRIKQTTKRTTLEYLYFEKACKNACDVMALDISHMVSTEHIKNRFCGVLQALSPLARPWALIAASPTRPICPNRLLTSA